ncbi:TPA: hypothetical protein ACVGNA_003388 [Pseudomonas aeruginosa]|nr:hypothetical protein [Pseudomonas aeruginosa]
MLVIRFKGWSVKLDHQVGGAGKFGIWQDEWRAIGTGVAAYEAER